jgi:cytoskeletal protein RodZ
VFEIGNSLREARVRQALEFPEIEQATKIRGKYLRALEDENFEQLPGQTYVKGFLRTYADYLGLEGQLYVDEYNSRYVTGAEEEPPIRYRGGSAMPGSTRLMSSAVVIALTAIGLATALVIAAWNFGAPGDPTVPGLGGQEQNAPKTKPKKKQSTTTVQSSTDFRVVVRATKGDSWLEVRRNSPVGKIEYQGTLYQGTSQLFTRPHLWMTLGRPSSLVIRLNGHKAQLPATSDPVDVSVTRKGLKPVT